MKTPDQIIEKMFACCKLMMDESKKDDPHRLPMLAFSLQCAVEELQDSLKRYHMIERCRCEADD